MRLNALLIYALAACDVFAAAIQGFHWRSAQNNVVTAVEALFEMIVHSKVGGHCSSTISSLCGMFIWSICS